MAIFKVEGGHRLKGEIRPQGAKNEALQIICAALLTPERVVLHNVPIIADVMQLLELMAAMGVKVERLSEDSFAMQADDINLDYLRSSDYHKRCRHCFGRTLRYAFRQVYRRKTQRYPMQSLRAFGNIHRRCRCVQGDVFGNRRKNCVRR